MSYASKSHVKFQRTEQRKKDFGRNFKVYVFTKKDTKLIPCDLIDYSNSGICIRFNGILDENEIVKLSLTNRLEKVYIDFNAQVRYRNINYVGLKFCDFNPFNCF